MTVVIIASGSGDEYGPSGANNVVVAAAIDAQTLDSIRRKPYGVSNSVRNHKWKEQNDGEEGCGAGAGAAHRDVIKRRKEMARVGKREEGTF